MDGESFAKRAIDTARDFPGALKEQTIPFAAESITKAGFLMAKSLGCVAGTGARIVRSIVNPDQSQAHQEVDLNEHWSNEK